MISTQNRATIGKILALGLLLATLFAMALASAPADAAVTSGKAFSWGSNQYGQLGNGNTGTGTNIPVAVRNLSGVNRVKAGSSHSLALKNDGTVWAWGYNYHGQLGNGTNDDTNVPVKVTIENVKAIATGSNHSLALKNDGTVWAWGYNYHGQLGNGTSGEGASSNYPVKVANIGTGARGIAAGEGFSLALMNDGTVKSWGNNYHGQLGNGTSGDGTEMNTPGAVKHLSGVRAIASDSSAEHALALFDNGTVKSWGNNYEGELGDGASLPGTFRATPVRVVNLTSVEAVATGGDHSLALLASGRVKSWGKNYHGQLGNDTHGSSTNRSIPGSVTGLTGVRSISGGANHSLAVLQTGGVKSWGSNSSGQLGNGGSIEINRDVPVGVKNLMGVKNIDGGYGFTLAATQ